MNLERLGSKVVAIVEADDPVDSVIKNMWQLNIRHLPVVRDGVPIGMVSDRDILFHVCANDLDAGIPGRSAAATQLATRAEQIMTKPVVALSPDDPVETAARLMANKKISSLPLVSEGNIVGIVTETDFLRCFNDADSLIPGGKTRQKKVVDLMSANVFSVLPNSATLTAIRLMREKQVRHVVVMQHERLVGIISDRDVLRGRRKPVDDHPVTASELRLTHEPLAVGIMTKHPQTISIEGTLAEAADKMVAHRIGALPVVNDGILSGIITETDLLRAFVADCRVDT